MNVRHRLAFLAATSVVVLAACVPGAAPQSPVTTTTSAASTTTLPPTTTTLPPGNATFDLLVVGVYGTDQQPGSELPGHVRIAAQESAAYLQTVSRGRLRATGTAATHIVDGRESSWFQIPQALASTCGAGPLLQTMAPTISALNAAGIDTSAYERVAVFSHQSATTCHWGGGAWNFYSQTGVTSLLDVFTIIHELGHSLGLTHVHGRNCATSVFAGSDCVYEEYGGRFDPMGQTFPVPVGYSTLSLEKLGWLDPDEELMVVSDGVYRIESPYAAVQTSAPSMLRIESGLGRRYAVEFRPPVGPDAPFGTPPHLVDSVPGIVLYDRASWSQLDATPGSQPNDLADGSLSIGATVQTADGLRLEVVAETGTYADVRVSGLV